MKPNGGRGDWLHYPSCLADVIRLGIELNWTTISGLMRPESDHNRGDGYEGKI